MKSAYSADEKLCTIFAASGGYIVNYQHCSWHPSSDLHTGCPSRRRGFPRLRRQ